MYKKEEEGGNDDATRKNIQDMEKIENYESQFIEVFDEYFNETLAAFKIRDKDY